MSNELNSKMYIDTYKSFCKKNLPQINGFCLDDKDILTYSLIFTKKFSSIPYRFFSNYQLNQYLRTKVIPINNSLANQIKPETNAIKETARLEIILGLINNALDNLLLLEIRSSLISEKDNIKDTVLRHLEASRSLLLEGPPGHNDFVPIPELVEEWINKQKSDERRRLARILSQKIKYVSHTEFLRKIQECVDKTAEEYERCARELPTETLPVIFTNCFIDKSNYYATLLFLHYWLIKGMPFDYAIVSLASVDATSIKGFIIDVDDMAYSGSQTQQDLQDSHYFYRNTIVDNLSGDKILKTVFPLWFVDLYLARNHFHYTFVRPYISSYAMKDWLNKDQRVKMLPASIIYSEIVNTLEETVGKGDSIKIRQLFGPHSKLAIYFNHKIADNVSTMLYPISFGIIPHRPLLNAFSENEEDFIIYNMNMNNSSANLKYTESNNNNVVEFLPFIKGCENKSRVSNIKTTGNLWKKRGNQTRRCPYAWYKKINYNRGTLKKGGKHKK